MASLPQPTGTRESWDPRSNSGTLLLRTTHRRWRPRDRFPSVLSSTGAVPGGERYATPGEKAEESGSKPISWVFGAEVLEGEGSETDEVWWIQTQFGTNLVHTKFLPIIPLVHGLADY